MTKKAGMIHNANLYLHDRVIGWSEDGPALQDVESTGVSKYTRLGPSLRWGDREEAVPPYRSNSTL